MADVRTRLEAAIGKQFILERELGGGGMSHVFLAEERRFGRQVVIKVFAVELATEYSSERFEREINLAARLQDPHIVPVLSAGVADGLLYFTMPFVDGESLRSRITASAPATLAPSDAESALRDVALALEYAHKHGIAHRDIKPENVLLAGRTAVVADFGIAKALSAATVTAVDGPTTLTRAGVTLGTPAYMAPEQVAGDEIDQRADIYAWGVMAYELLTGAHPFAHRSGSAQLMAAHLSEQPPPFYGSSGNISTRMHALVMRCLSKDPADRPANGAELVREFDLGVRDPRRRNGASIPRWQVRAAVFTALAALAFGGMLILQRMRRDRDPIVASPVAPASNIGTVAVLPFTNVAGNAQDEYFSDGMTDELARALSRLPSIRVVARSSAYAYRGKSMTGQQIGKALQVASVVEGTVRRAGDRLRVTAELTSTADGLVIWAETYESRSGDVFAIQDRFTKSIVSALAPTLAGRKANVASESRGTSNAKAYDLYLKGRYFWNKRTAVGLARAASYFQEAIAEDAHYALAYSGLADAYAVIAAFGTMEPREAYALAKPAALRAIALDSTLAEAHTGLGFINLYYDLDPVAARREFDKALALDSNYATARLFNGWYELVQNGPAAALRQVRIAEQLEPLSPIISTRVATMLTYGRMYAAAQKQITSALELDPTFALAEDQRARAYAAEGQLEMSIAAARKAMAMGYLHGRSILGYSLARLGKRDEAKAHIDTLISESRRHYVAPYDIALIFAGLGDRDHALEWLGRALAARDHEFLHLPLDPLMGVLSSDPRFAALVARRH